MTKSKIKTYSHHYAEPPINEMVESWGQESCGWINGYAFRINERDDLVSRRGMRIHKQWAVEQIHKNGDEDYIRELIKESGLANESQKF